MKNIFFSLFIIGFLTGCKSEKSNDESRLSGNESTSTQSENSNNWQDLLSEENVKEWRGYNEEKGLPDGWVLEGETLMSLGKGADIGGDIVYGKEEFGEFELSLEWKISPGGNSGIFYHVKEGEQYEALYFTGPEFQLRDHQNSSEQQDSLHILGADYGMYEPRNVEKAKKEAGEWNSSRIVFTEEKVTYWLNGEKTVEFTPWSEDWRSRKDAGKWKDFPDYGKAREGLIGLQDHGSEIWFRNIRIRKL
ncbi:DUF1080 domain-containing protein [Antarcticibacterium flavum]|uniref:DUF1080 domain-containing protein n=1 Tax=Antarcticibacterium flavum TaxID=2058175 RepID=A0A5B7X8J7_9FLAO|nr:MULTISPECIES: DUF1080 domain-containing protein [Antarcticibacterium]MCM4160889.1 DUF1080 domain-containing protein [Antarcticibacterium sp. W02-3]QCY71112.1 DUF1080 domain-containing protein [Antarcticibacterium flavum]